MLHAIILAGGGGERLWPLSRTTYPKQFLPLLSDVSLLQHTAQRVTDLVSPERLWIVTGRDHRDIVQSQLVPLFRGETSALHILTEPAARNTAAAIGLAAIHAQHVDPEATLLILPADHWIEHPEDFAQLLSKAVPVADHGHFVTFGIVPDRPATGYGYIMRGQRLGNPSSQDWQVEAYGIERFVEKPQRETAERYLASGNYYWNAGIFLARSSMILEEIASYLPDLYKGLSEIAAGIGSSSATDIVEKVYARLPSVSVDVGVLEKSTRLAVIPADIGWSDLGEWSAVHSLSSHDARGNSLSPSVVDLESRNTFVRGSDRPIVTIGLEDTIVVDGEDALLVCRQDRTQDVKRAIQHLQIQHPKVVHAPRTMPRPWGTYTVLDVGPGFKVKRLVVTPGASLSLQMHQHRSEHWVVVRGLAKVINGESEAHLMANESTYIPAGVKHRLSNPGTEPLEVIEVSTGSYIEEDDIVRFPVS